MIFAVYRLDSDGERTDLLYTELQHLAESAVDKYSEMYPHAIVDYDLV